jgi:hypothetical protein
MAMEPPVPGKTRSPAHPVSNPIINTVQQQTKDGLIGTTEEVHPKDTSSPLEASIV